MSQEAPPQAGASGSPPPASNSGSGQPSGAGASTGAPPAEPKAGTPGSQPSGTPTPSEYEYKVGGQSFKVPLEKLITLAQQGHDYTQKTQTLASDRKRLEQERQAIAELQRRLQTPEGDHPAEADPMQQLAERQQALEQALADDKLDKTLAGLKSKYPLLNEQLFLLEASQAQVQKFEDMEQLAKAHQEARERERLEIFEAMIGDEKNPIVAKHRQGIIDGYLKIKADEGKPKHESGSTGSPGGSGAPPKPKSWDEADERARKILEGAR